MRTLRILSWNVNGLRAIYGKGFLEWLQKEMPDILCIQETKARADQVPPELKNIQGYCSFFSSGDKKGYGGVGLFSRELPKSLKFSLDIDGFNDEHRTIVADWGEFLIFNVYFPNGKASKDRLEYKLKFYDQFLDLMDQLLAEGGSILICFRRLNFDPP